jgi:hypothetical protein
MSYLEHVKKELKGIEVGETRFVELDGRKVASFRMSMAIIRNDRVFKSYCLANVDLNVVRIS